MAEPLNQLAILAAIYEMFTKKQTRKTGLHQLNFLQGNPLHIDTGLSHIGHVSCS